VLSVQTQNGTPSLWALVDDAAPIVNRTFKTYGTGNAMPDADSVGQFLGTYQVHDGLLVFHVFEQQSGK
jgi:hypothetical protein